MRGRALKEKRRHDVLGAKARADVDPWIQLRASGLRLVKGTSVLRVLRSRVKDRRMEQV